MKSFDTELKKYAERVRLKASERRELRERVLSYMEYHPLPKQLQKEPLQSLVTTEPIFILDFSSRIFRVASGVFAFVLLVGVPLLAERSVPGDPLYLVKTEVTEGVRAQFANSPYEKVTFETKLIERRIAEARLMASEGKLTEEVEAEIAETVKGHAVAAQNGLAELRVDNAEEAAIAQIAFGSALEVQSAVLDANVSTAATSSVASILDVVNTVREEVVANTDTTAPSFDGLMAGVESETTRSYEFLETIKRSATEEELADIERRIADIDRKIAGAKELRTTDEAAAILDLTNALSLTQKLIAFMTDIDVRETVALEILVPVELTPEERTAAVVATLEQAATLRHTVDKHISLLTDESLMEKVDSGLDSYAAQVATATSSLGANDVQGAETAAKEAYAFIEDIVKILEPLITPEPVIPVPEVTLPDVTTGTTSTSTLQVAGTSTVEVVEQADITEPVLDPEVSVE